MTNTILLADDSVTIQKVIELTFMDEDYEVVAVGNGDEALDRLEEVTPDVVIADVHMPGASGYDVARRAKQLHPQAPVLLLVGTFEPFDEADYQASGADAYLKKPFDSQELLHRVSDLMEARAGAPAAAPPEAAEKPAPSPAPAAAAPPTSAPPPAAEPAGAETRFVPTSKEGAEAWRPSDAAAVSEAADEVEPLGTQRMPTFGAPAAAPPPAGEAPAKPEAGAAAESGWSGWGITSEPEEVAAPLAPSEEGEPAWPRGESFEPAWESVETVPGEDEEAETPSWALEDTAEEEPRAAAAPAETPQRIETETPKPVETPPSAPPPAAPSEPALPTSGAPAETIRHAAEPFPELARPQPSAPPPAAGAEASVSGVPGPAAPAATAGDGREPALSEADVDRVARRVAELLGDRVIREVAWEVVPDLAEVVIKDRLRELESQVD